MECRFLNVEKYKVYTNKNTGVEYKNRSTNTYVFGNWEHLIAIFNQIKRNGNEEKNKVYAKIEIQITLY